jgi:hypothetical protein
MDEAYAEGDVGEEVERQPSAKRHSWDCGQRIADVLDRLLQAECEQDDARDHRQVEVAVAVACESHARCAARLRELTLRADGVDVEVRPPERGDDDDAEDGCRDDAGRERNAGGADADRDDRLAEGDDDDEAVAFGEVRRRYAPALAVADQGAQVVDREGDDPQRGLRTPVEEAGDQMA